MQKTISYNLLITLCLLALSAMAKADLQSDLALRIHAYTRSELAQKKNGLQLNIPVCSSENMIHQMNQQLAAMEISMKNLQELEDAHVATRIESFKESLLTACCKKSNNLTSRTDRNQPSDQSEGQHHGGGHGRRRQ